MSPPAARPLIVLDKQGQLSLSDLAETARVTLGSMSQPVRRLEQLAYVTKSRGTQDRRKVLFTLTDQGGAAATASRRHRRDWLNGQLAGLTAAERDDIARGPLLLLRIAAPEARPTLEQEHHASSRSSSPSPRPGTAQPAPGPALARDPMSFRGRCRRNQRER